MKVLFLQDHATLGGAAQAASRYAEVLRKLGNEVTQAVGDEKAGGKFLRLNGKPGRGLARLLSYFYPKAMRQEKRTIRVAEQWKALLEKVRPDLVWAHNLHGGEKWGWQPDLLMAALAKVPVIWTLHDMWALGDGPAYFNEADLPEKSRRSFLRRILQTPGAQGRLQLTAPSEWLCGLAQRAVSTNCRRFEYVLDPSVMNPANRDASRDALGLISSDFLLMTVAENLSDPRKGLELLRSTWSRLKKTPGFSRIRLGCIGRNIPDEFKTDPQVLCLGQVTNPEVLSGWLAAADLYVHPASQDNFPLTVQESQACGTPAIVFERGGLAETVEHGRTGWVLKDRSVEGLLAKLVEVIQSPGILASMRVLARDKTMQKQNLQVFSSSWKALLSSFPDGCFVPAL